MKKLYALLCITIAAIGLTNSTNALDYYLLSSNTGWEESETNRLMPVEGDENLISINVPEINGSFYIGVHGDGIFLTYWGVPNNSDEFIVPGKQMALTDENFVSVALVNYGTAKDVTITLDSSNMHVSVEYGEISYYTYGIRGNIFNEESTTQIIPMFGDRADIYSLEGYTHLFDGEFDVVYFHYPSMEVYNYYGPSKENEEVEIGPNYNFESYNGNKYSITEGFYNLVFSSRCSTFIVDPEDNPVKGVFSDMLGWYREYDYILFSMPFIKMNLPEDTEFKMVCEMDGVKYTSSNVTSNGVYSLEGLTPGTSYDVTCYIEAKTGENTYKTKSINATVTTKNLGECIYVVGNMTDWKEPSEANEEFYKNWSMAQTEPGSKVYTGIFEFPANPMFRFYTDLNGWEENSLGSQYNDSPIQYWQFGLPGEDLFYSWLTEGKGSYEFPEFGGGRVKITIDLSTLLMTIEKTEEEGIYKVSVDICDSPRYFNLSGIEVEKPSGGIYIEVRNGQSRKVYIK